MTPFLLAAAAVAQPSPYFLDSSTVVRVVCEDGWGSAFYIGGGRYISAAHVVRPRIACTIKGTKVRIAKRGSHLDYEILTASYRPPFRAIYSCVPFREGQTYFATGYADGNPWTVTQRLIGTSAPFYNTGEVILRGSSTEGMSGGPVSDNDGIVHGIVTAGATEGITASYFVQLADTPLCRRSRA